LYGQDRLEACFFEKPNPRDEALSFCFEILSSGSYYDDPSDSIRTMANMEDTTIRPRVGCPTRTGSSGRARW
jgi:hypothetical protein